MAKLLSKAQGAPDGAMVSRFERGLREPNLFVIVEYAKLARVNRDPDCRSVVSKVHGRTDTGRRAGLLERFPAMKKSSDEFENFDKAMRGLLAVPYSELHKKLEEEKHAKSKHKKKRSTSTASSVRASSSRKKRVA